MTAAMCSGATTPLANSASRAETSPGWAMESLNTEACIGLRLSKILAGLGRRLDAGRVSSRRASSARCVIGAGPAPSLSLLPQNEGGERRLRRYVSVWAPLRRCPRAVFSARAPSGAPPVAIFDEASGLLGL